MGITSILINILFVRLQKYSTYTQSCLCILCRVFEIIHPPSLARKHTHAHTHTRPTQLACLLGCTPQPANNDNCLPPPPPLNLFFLLNFLLWLVNEYFRHVLIIVLRHKGIHNYCLYRLTMLLTLFK